MVNKLKKIVLENGFTIYFYKDMNKHSTNVKLIVKYGSYNKEFKVGRKTYTFNDGIAHLLEHLLIEKSYYGDLMEYFGKKQMNRNATTYLNRTQYYFSAIKYEYEDIEKLIKGINKSNFTPDDVKEIKNAIYQEIRQRRDRKGAIAWEKVIYNLFPTIKVNSAIGALKEVEEITYENVKMCYETFYRPNNQALLIAGRFDEEQVIDIVKKSFDDIDSKPSNFKLIIPKHTNKVRKTYEEIMMPTGVTLCTMAFKIDITNIKGYELIKFDGYVADMLAMNFGVFSKLRKKLLDDETIAALGYTTQIIFNDLVIVIEASVYNKDKFIESIINQINNLVYNEELFNLLTKDTKARIIDRQDDLARMISPLIDNIFNYAYEEFDNPKDIDKCSFIEFKETIEKLSFDNYTTVIIKDE